MQIDAAQAENIATTMFANKLDRALCRSASGYARLARDSRVGFVEECLRDAAALGLRTEQGIASVALASWHLEPGFERKSAYLQALLRSSVGEVRKVYAMNEWVHTLLGNPADAAAADGALKAAFHRTVAWAKD